MNKTNKILKIIQINKGNSDLSNKTDQINDIITNYNPHIIIINELNNDKNDTISRFNFKDYVLEIDNLACTDGKSRTGMLIHTKIHYRRRKDLETEGTSTLWIQLTYPGKKTTPYSRCLQTIPKIGCKK